MVRCDTCRKDFSRSDALTRHKKYSCSLSPKVEVKRNYVAKCKELNSKPIDNMSQDIPTIDGAAFSGEKPKSKEINKIMDMLNTPQEKRATIMKEEKKLDGQKVPSKDPPAKKMKIIPLPSKSDHLISDQSSDEVGEEEDAEEDEEEEEMSPPVVKASHLNTEEKQIANKFSQLFCEMKQTGKNNRGMLYILLDEMRDNGIIDETDYDKVYNAIICK